MTEKQIGPGNLTPPRGDREERLDPRQLVSRRVELWLLDDVFAIGSVLTASAHTIRTKVSDRAAALLSEGQRCLLRIHAEWGVFATSGRIEKINRHAVDIEILEPLTSGLRAPKPLGDPHRA